MSKLLDLNIEKGVKNMDLRGLENKTNAVSRKGVSSSPIVQQDIDTVFAINTGITQYMVSDNAFYRYIHQHYADKSSGRLPYLADNKVMRADNKHLKCIADGHIKISPYGFFEGAAAAARSMYIGTMRQISDKVNFQFLVQAYMLYSAFCLGIASNGQISIITSNADVIKAIPADDNDKCKALQRTNPITDDYEHGIVQCVELVPKQSGYTLKPAIINASKQDYLILPLAWVDYLITYINNLLKIRVCKVCYYDPSGTLQTVIASNNPIKGNARQCIGCDYIKKTKTNIGWVRAVEIKSGEIIAFPISHFNKIEMLK